MFAGRTREHVRALAPARKLLALGRRAMRCCVQLEPTVIAACVLGLALGAWFALALRRIRDSWRARAYNRRGRRAEHAAARLLESRGYRVVAQQLRAAYSVRVGGAEQNIDLVLDYVVERGGERFAAEVKSGAAAGGLARADTRRQLLEYQLALGSRRVLLVDPERDSITEVTFPIPDKPAPVDARRSSPLRFVVAALVVLLTAAVGWLAWR